MITVQRFYKAIFTSPVRYHSTLSKCKLHDLAGENGDEVHRENFISKGKRNQVMKLPFVLRIIL